MQIISRTRCKSVHALVKHQPINQLVFVFLSKQNLVSAHLMLEPPFVTKTALINQGKDKYEHILWCCEQFNLRVLLVVRWRVSMDLASFFQMLTDQMSSCVCCCFLANGTTVGVLLGFVWLVGKKLFLEASDFVNIRISYFQQIVVCWKNWAMVVIMLRLTSVCTP